MAAACSVRTHRRRRYWQQTNVNHSCLVFCVIVSPCSWTLHGGATGSHPMWGGKPFHRERWWPTWAGAATPTPTSRDVTNQAGYVAEKRCHDDDRWRYVVVVELNEASPTSGQRDRNKKCRRETKKICKRRKSHEKERTKEHNSLQMKLDMNRPRNVSWKIGKSICYPENKRYPCFINHRTRNFLVKAIGNARIFYTSDLFFILEKMFCYLYSYFWIYE